MIKNYLKSAWRNLLKGKSFSVINISGLAVGMAGAALIILWLHHEISFDKFHDNKDRLHEVYGLTNVEGKLFTIDQTSQPLVPAMKQDFPEVENATRFAPVSSFLFTANEKKLNGVEGAFVDPSFLKMFSFPLEEGVQDFAENVYSIVITESLAHRLFGSEHVINKSIQIDSTDHFKITGILKNLPSNSKFDFEYLLPFPYLKKLGWNNDSWLSNNISSFVLLKKGTDLKAFNSKIQDITRRYSKNEKAWTHFLFPLHQWHLYIRFENGKAVGGRIETVKLFAVIAAFILLLACINFMNLSTARSEKRAKEVGIRKVAGSGKGLLIGQFIAESILTAAVAGVFAILLVQFTLPLFNNLIETQMTMPLTEPGFLILAPGFIILTGILAGIYPAFFLSSFKPISIFQKKFKDAQTVFAPRKILVVLQFSFAIMLIIATIVVQKQIQLGAEKEKGYSANNLLFVDFAGDIEKNYPLIRQELINKGIASSVTKTMGSITTKGSNTWGLRWQGRKEDENPTIGLFNADADLIKTAGLTLLQGRDIDINKYPSDSNAVLLNETAVATMGFANPIGQIITQPSDNSEWKVVGVVKDYIINSPYEKIPPMVIQGPAAAFRSMHIKLNTNASTSGQLAKAATIFNKYNPSYPFEYKFTGEEFARNFASEEKTKTLSFLFASLSIFISCLGLFGLSAYMAENRIKEVGVRKVLGASVFNIAKLLSVDFIKLVLVSILIASPIAWYAMNKWLEDYTFRIDIGWMTFALAGMVAIIIALVTVSFQSVKAAMANPVKSLRSE
ncbi:ABC transporter permease [Pollutibacter soli]|uniref:ABC transporter permease n=1 Tax=Pollutibacter soli TaxID=3034157 RepID=UPI00301405BF